MSGDHVRSKFASTGEGLERACAHHVQGHLELATDYMRLSAWTEAGRVLERGLEIAQSAGEIPYPLLYYYRAYLSDLGGGKATARESIESARNQDLTIEIFPFRREDLQVLGRSLEIEPSDANAASLLGDILYSRNRQNEALTIWRSSLNLPYYLARSIVSGTLPDGRKAVLWASEWNNPRPDVPIVSVRMVSSPGPSQAQPILFGVTAVEKPRVEDYR